MLVNFTNISRISPLEEHSLTEEPSLKRRKIEGGPSTLEMPSDLITMFKLRGDIPVKNHVYYMMHKKPIDISSVSQIFFWKNQLVFLYHLKIWERLVGTNYLGIINLKSKQITTWPTKLLGNGLERISANQFRMINQSNIGYFFQLGEEGIRLISANDIKHDELPQLSFREVSGRLIPDRLETLTDNENNYQEINTHLKMCPKEEHVEAFNTHYFCFSYKLKIDLKLFEQQYFKEEKRYHIYSLATGKEISLNSRQFLDDCKYDEEKNICRVNSLLESHCLLKGKSIYIIDTMQQLIFKKITTSQNESSLKKEDWETAVMFTEFDGEGNSLAQFQLDIELADLINTDGFSFLPSQGENLFIFSNMTGNGKIYKIIKSGGSYEGIQRMGGQKKKENLLVINDYYFVEKEAKKRIIITVPGSSHNSLTCSYKENQGSKNCPRKIFHPESLSNGGRFARFNDGFLVLFESKRGKDQQLALRIEVRVVSKGEDPIEQEQFKEVAESVAAAATPSLDGLFPRSRYRSANLTSHFAAALQQNVRASVTQTWSSRSHTINDLLNPD